MFAPLQFLRLACLLFVQAPQSRPADNATFLICVTNERSGDVSIIDGNSFERLATIPVGKRPRGIHAGRDGNLLFVAVSGTPIAPPPRLDEKGNPVFEDEDDGESDHAADGIAVIDLAARKLLRKIAAGSDPEQFAIGADGKYLYAANEDVATLSVINIVDGKVEQIVPVKKEPEGVGVTPDGRRVFVTCETGGEVLAIDTAAQRVLGSVTVGGRPRSVAFSPDGKRAYVPSESSGELHLLDISGDVPKVEKSIKLPAGARPMCLAISRDGARLFASTGRAGTVLVIETGSLTVSATIKAGKRPWGIALSPDESVLFAANGPSNDISVIDLRQNKEIQKIPAGESPWGVTIVPRQRSGELQRSAAP
jgi:YVTN family beta-propeller protein